LMSGGASSSVVSGLFLPGRDVVLIGVTW